MRQPRDEGQELLLVDEPDEYEELSQEAKPLDLVRGHEYWNSLSEKARNTLVTDGYQTWRRKVGYVQLERPLEYFRDESIERSQRAVIASGGWLKYVRSLRRLSTNQMALVLGMKKSTYVTYENAERKGTITIGRFSELAQK